MKSMFKCLECNLIFEAEEKKIEYMDVTFGPCARYVADCPSCGSEAGAYKRPKPAKNEYSMAPVVCGNPGGCCQNCES